MDARELVIQDCGCISIPEDLSRELDMSPGTTLQLTVNVLGRSITLVAPPADGSWQEPSPRAACPIA